MNFELPDQLPADYGNIDESNVVRAPGSMRPVPNTPQSYASASVANPYSQYGRMNSIPSMHKPSQNPQAQQNPYPTEMVNGMPTQMVNGLPNVGPFLVDEVSNTPFHRGDFVPVYDVTKQAQEAPRLAGIQSNPRQGGNYGNIMQWWTDMWSQGVPAAGIDKDSSPEQRALLGAALKYVGVLTVDTDDWNKIQEGLAIFQSKVGIPATLQYDVATYQKLKDAWALQSQGKSFIDIINATGILPTAPAGSVPTVSAPPAGSESAGTGSSSEDNNLMKYGLIALGVLVAGYIAYKLMSKKNEDEE